MTPADRQAVMQMVADPENVFIAHTKGYEFFPGISTKLVQIAGENAYEQRPIAVISDTYGHAVYEIYRFAATE
jgi:hypothetical protein